MTPNSPSRLRRLSKLLSFICEQLGLDDIAEHLSAGDDVAVLCEGDPFLYGSFMYLFARLSNDHPTRVIPGVSSLGACAAAAGVPLVSRNETLLVVPGPLDESEMEARIKAAHAVAVIKVGRHCDKVRRVVERLGLSQHAHYVEHASMTNQRVLMLGVRGDERLEHVDGLL